VISVLIITICLVGLIIALILDPVVRHRRVLLIGDPSNRVAHPPHAQDYTVAQAIIEKAVEATVDKRGLSEKVVVRDCTYIPSRRRAHVNNIFFANKSVPLKKAEHLTKQHTILKVRKTRSELHQEEIPLRPHINNPGGQFETFQIRSRLN
jgi:hypothetical protein